MVPGLQIAQFRWLHSGRGHSLVMVEINVRDRNCALQCVMNAMKPVDQSVSSSTDNSQPALWFITFLNSTFNQIIRWHLILHYPTLSDDNDCSPMLEVSDPIYQLVEGSAASKFTHRLHLSLLSSVSTRSHQPRTKKQSTRHGHYQHEKDSNAALYHSATLFSTHPTLHLPALPTYTSPLLFRSLDDVHSAVRVNNPTQLSYLQPIRRILERLLHRTSTEPAQVPT